MKKPVLLLLLIATMAATLTSFAQSQTTTPPASIPSCGTEAECNAAFQKKVAAQAAEDKAAKDKTEAIAKAVAKMDNKNPQPVSSEVDRLRVEKLQSRMLLDRQKLETIQALIKQPVAQAQASEKAYNDAVLALQKSSHAEGCQLAYDEKGDVKVSANGKDVWDCSQAANVVNAASNAASAK